MPLTAEIAPQNSNSSEDSAAPQKAPAGVRRVWMMTGLAFLAGLLISGGFAAAYENNRLQERRKVASELTTQVARDVGDQLNRSLSASYALAAVIRHGDGSIKNFKLLATEMLKLYVGISSLQLAPNGVISSIVPLAGNEQAIGHNLLEDSKRNKEAILAVRTRSLTLAGPFELLQGGQAVVGRLPVFISRPGENEYFWGFTAVLIRIPELLNTANIQRIVDHGYGYELSRIHPDTGKRDIFSRSGRPLARPVHQTITVPNGTWTISVEPMGGWHSPTALLLEILLVLLSGVLAAAFAHWLGRQPILLMRMVEERTAELSAANKSLQAEIAERKRSEEERLNLERQLLHAQKLESLGVLAGGIAHDFNNILTSIIGNADLALMRLNPESPVVENLKWIEKGAARAADLAKQMLAYSGKGKFVIEALDLNRLVEEMLHMLQVSISKKAVLRLNPHRPLPAVEADATQLRQIVMNLVINASEAIGDRSGVIAITTGCMECDRNYLKEVWLDENLREGLYVYLEIADTGCGMDRETMEKLFDPFFTTKFAGRGLGMAAVLGIIRGHKGAIKVYSEPGKGTTFKVLLPAGGKPADEFNVDNRDNNWRGSGTVLLVDDEETVRAIGSSMLHELGFEVVTAEDGRQALELFKTRPGITLVILDLTMPHLDGEQTFRELRRLDPGLRVIMTSGFNEHEVTQKFTGKGLSGFIQKPYKLPELREVISSMPARGVER